MEEAWSDDHERHEFTSLKKSYKTLQCDEIVLNNEIENGSLRISTLLLRSKKLYEPILSYFDYINIKKKNDWFLQSNTISVSNSEKRIVTNVLLNQEHLLSGFTFFFGYDIEIGILYFTSPFGVLAVVGIRNSEEIKSQVVDVQTNFIDNDLFVCTIGLLATEEEIFFVNNIDELIFNNVRQLMTVKGIYLEF